MNKIYDRQNTDTDKSWLSFCAYRDLGRDRTLEKVRLQSGLRSVRKLESWSSKHNWVKRCAAYDDDEMQTESIALQKLRLKRRLKLEKDAWDRYEKLIKKADQLLAIPIVSKSVSQDGATVFMPSNKWSLRDAIAFYEYSDKLGLLASGGETKKLDELEAVTLLADLGVIPQDAVIAIGRGYQQFKENIREAFL
jgi:hypothetical protein